MRLSPKSQTYALGGSGSVGGTSRLEGALVGAGDRIRVIEKAHDDSWLVFEGSVFWLRMANLRELGALYRVAPGENAVHHSIPRFLGSSIPTYDVKLTATAFISRGEVSKQKWRDCFSSIDLVGREREMS